MNTKTYEEIKVEKIEKIKKRQQRENILTCIRHKEEMLELDGDGKKIIYPNQQEAAVKCIKAFNNGARAICLIAQPGVGKTGTAQAVMINMTTNPNDNEIIYNDNIIICTGMSDKDWETQFKVSVLPVFKDNIFHRQNFIKHKDKLNSLENGIIITDECHIASGSKMTMAKTLKEGFILDIDELEKRNIKMLDISATPDAVLRDYKDWSEKCEIIKINPGPMYKGFEVMLEEGRIIDSPNLEDTNECYQLLKILDERYKNTTKKYFIFRLLKDDIRTNLEIISKKIKWDFKSHDSKIKIKKIDDLMENAPKKHTIIFIKGFWRASKRITMCHIGATYEPIPKKRDVSVTAQSLAARHCDNYEYSGDQLNINLRPLHFCDKEAIEQYIEWYNNDCNFYVSKYNSSRINSNGNGKVTSKETKVNTNIVNGIGNNNTIINEMRVPIIISGINEKDLIFKENKEYKKSITKKEKIDYVLSLLKDNEKYVKLFNFINNPDVICSQITQPDPKNGVSYKKHILDVVQASDKNKPFSVDLDREKKLKNNWQMFIDSKEKRLCFIIWCIDQELYKIE